MTTITVDYDCGYRVQVPTALHSNQTALHNASLLDTLAMLADADHDQNCPTCRPVGKA